MKRQASSYETTSSKEEPKELNLLGHQTNSFLSLQIRVAKFQVLLLKDDFQVPKKQTFFLPLDSNKEFSLLRVRTLYGQVQLAGDA